jgi:hypothetical protein
MQQFQRTRCELQTKTICYVGRLGRPENLLFVSEDTRVAEDYDDVITCISCVKSLL